MLRPYAGDVLLPGGSGVAHKPWSGRFTEKTDRRVEAFTESISFDR